MGNIIRLPLTIEVKQNSVKGVYLIPLVKKNGESENIKIVEMKKVYEVETFDNFDLIDFYIAIYNFVNSPYFSKKKPIKVNGKLLNFVRYESYSRILEKLKPCFN